MVATQQWISFFVKITSPTSVGILGILGLMLVEWSALNPYFMQLKLLANVDLFWSRDTCTLRIARNCIPKHGCDVQMMISCVVIHVFVAGYHLNWIEPTSTNMMWCDPCIYVWYLWNVLSIVYWTNSTHCNQSKTSNYNILIYEFILDVNMVWMKHLKRLTHQLKAVNLYFL